MRMRHVLATLGAAAIGLSGALALTSPAAAAWTNPGGACGKDGVAGEPGEFSTLGSAGKDGGTTKVYEGKSYTCQATIVVDKRDTETGKVTKQHQVWKWTEVAAPSSQPPSSAPPSSAPASSAPASQPPTSPPATSASPTTTGTTSAPATSTPASPPSTGSGHKPPKHGDRCDAKDDRNIRFGDHDALKCGKHSGKWTWARITTLSITSITGSPCLEGDHGYRRTIGDKIAICTLPQGTAVWQWAVDAHSDLGSNCDTVGVVQIADGGIALSCQKIESVLVWKTVTVVEGATCPAQYHGIGRIHNSRAYKCAEQAPAVWTWTRVQLLPAPVQVVIGSPCDQASAAPVVIAGRPCQCQAVPQAPATQGDAPTEVTQYQPVSDDQPISSDSSLPVTGTNVGEIIAFSIALLAAGTIMIMLYVRRCRTRFVA
jgi:hypothetical protein